MKQCNSFSTFTQITVWEWCYIRKSFSISLKKFPDLELNPVFWHARPVFYLKSYRDRQSIGYFLTQTTFWQNIGSAMQTAECSKPQVNGTPLSNREMNIDVNIFTQTTVLEWYYVLKTFEFVHVHTWSLTWDFLIQGQSFWPL